MEIVYLRRNTPNTGHFLLCESYSCRKQRRTSVQQHDPEVLTCPSKQVILISSLHGVLWFMENTWLWGGVLPGSQTEECYAYPAGPSAGTEGSLWTPTHCCRECKGFLSRPAEKRTRERQNKLMKIPLVATQQNTSAQELDGRSDKRIQIWWTQVFKY